MSHNNLINDKKNALLAYKEKILNEIKYCEKSIVDLRANIKIKNFYDDHGDSSDSEDDFPSAIDIAHLPSVAQLKQQQAMIKTCLHATQELTGLTILQSAVDVLVEDPKFEGERPVTEPGNWREVIAECRLDFILFTITFFMHTPDRKFAPTSYRGLHVVPVKPPQELELSRSVLNSLKTPSDAVEVIRSYAVSYRSRRTTMARLGSKYGKKLSMEPHPEGGYVMKCADLLEVCWRLENKWSPVARFHHRMKFDLEFMEESYIKSIAQAHKQLLDPAINTDERTLLLADIISTCLEARGTVDPESDLESKTTERDIDRRDSENEKRDSEVMAPPKSLPKKGKQKNTEQNTPQKRSLDDKAGETRAKKMKNDDPEVKKNSIETNNSRKSKINDVPTEGGKKRKINEVNKVNAKNVKKRCNIEDADVNSKDNNKVDKATNIKAKNTKPTENNAKSNNVKEKEDKLANGISKPKNIKESVSNDDKNTNDKTKHRVTKESDNSEAKGINAKPKTKKLEEPSNILKEPATIDNNPKPKTKTAKETDKNLEMNDNVELKEKQSKNSDKTKSLVKQTNKELNKENAKNVVNKAKNVAIKETGTLEEGVHNKNNVKTKNIDEKKSKTVANTKSKENIDSNKDAARTKNKNSEKTSNTEKTIDANTNKIDNKTKNTDTAKAKSVPNTKNDNLASKKAPESNTNVANTKNDKVTIKVTEKKTTSKDKVTEVANKDNEKNIKEKTSKINVKNATQTVKKGTETSIKNKDRLSQNTNKLPESNAKEKPALIKQIPEKVLDNIKKTKDLAKSLTKNITKKPIITKVASHRSSLKPQKLPKLLNAGNTKSIGTGNTGKENGGKGTKIPQKKLSIISEGSSKKNMLRVSPRKIPSKFKPTSQETYKQKMMKSTNIPRLLKKPSPKTT